MDRQELVSLVDHVNAVWGKAPYKEERSLQLKAWNMFLRDLPLKDVLKTVNRLALTSPFVPRVGELRREVIMGRLPDPAQGWAELQAWRDKVNNGSTPPALSSNVQEVVNLLGKTSLGLHTNGDRDLFMSTFDRIVKTQIEAMCEVPPGD